MLEVSDTWRARSILDPVVRGLYILLFGLHMTQICPLVTAYSYN